MAPIVKLCVNEIVHNGGGEVELKEVYILSVNVLLMEGLSAADVKRKACGKFSRCGSILTAIYYSAPRTK